MPSLRSVARRRPEGPRAAVLAAALVGLLAGPGAMAQAEPLPCPATAGSLAPNLTTGPDGRTYLTWIQPDGDDQQELCFASRDDGEWSAGRTIARGDDWFVNWADFPSLVVMADGLLAAHWLQKSGAGTYAYDVVIARSADHGATFGEPFKAHRDGTQTEHGFVSLLGAGDGALDAVWLDGREMKPGGHDHGNMTLRYARIGKAGELSDEAVLDPRVCECCQTAAARTDDGVIVAYRDRSDTEVRDISIVRQREGKWTAPRRIGADEWQLGGCPVNGPALAAAGRHVAVAWFTAANGDARVWLAHSHDAGDTFAEAVRIDSGNPIGRVGVLLLDDGSTLVSWLERVGRDGELRLRRVGQGGKPGDPITVAAMSIARSSGFPRLARRGNELVFAWTADGVKTAVMAVPE